jgi:hypothetical protein
MKHVKLFEEFLKEGKLGLNTKVDSSTKTYTFVYPTGKDSKKIVVEINKKLQDLGIESFILKEFEDVIGIPTKDFKTAFIKVLSEYDNIVQHVYSDGTKIDKNIVEESLLRESYGDNHKEYAREFKKRGLTLTTVFNGDLDMWWKDFELGRFVVSFEPVESQISDWNYHVFFVPKPKYKKALFGLIKTKERQLGKFIDFAEGYIDFSEGLFEVDDKEFLKELLKIIDDALEKSAKIAKVEYLSYADSKYKSHTAFDEIKQKNKSMKHVKLFEEFVNEKLDIIELVKLTNDSDLTARKNNYTIAHADIETYLKTPGDWSNNRILTDVNGNEYKAHDLIDKRVRVGKRWFVVKENLYMNII